MEDNKYNENEKTVMFTPVKDKEPVQSNPEFNNPPVQNNPVSAESLQRKPSFVEPPEEVLEENYEEYEYEEYDDDDEKKNSKTTVTLLIIAIIAALIFLGTVIWGIFRFTGTEKEDIKDEIVEKEPESDPEEIPVPEEEEEEEENNEAYNIVFLSDSVEREGNEYTVRAKLYNKFMVFEDERRVTLTSDTEIIEDGEELSLVSFASLIKELKNPDATFKGKINCDSWEVINISYSSEILKTEEEEDPLDEVEEELVEEPASKDDVAGAVLSEEE